MCTTSECCDKRGACISDNPSCTEETKENNTEENNTEEDNTEEEKTEEEKTEAGDGDAVENESDGFGMEMKEIVPEPTPIFVINFSRLLLQ